MANEYEIPENSLSYFAQANTTPQPFMSASEEEATLSANERQELEPEFSEEKQVVADLEIVSKPAPRKSPIALQLAKRREAAQQENLVIEQTVEEETKPLSEEFLDMSQDEQLETPLFSEALSKMQQNKAHRQAEAQRLGIILPSQGGDMAAVSPSLSKMQQTLKQIMAR